MSYHEETTLCVDILMLAVANHDVVIRRKECELEAEKRYSRIQRFVRVFVNLVPWGGVRIWTALVSCFIPSVDPQLLTLFYTGHL